MTGKITKIKAGIKMKKIFLFTVILFCYIGSSIAGQDNSITIFLDPQYLGRDKGPDDKDQDLESGDLTLKLSKKIRSIIMNKWPEYDVILTRDKDAAASEKEKIDLVNSGKQGILLGIVVGWSDDSKKSGITLINSELILGGETEIESKPKQTDSRYSEIMNEIVADLSKELKKNYDEGILLSKRLCNHLTSSILIESCSSSIEPDTLLLHANIPSSLLKIGYLSNKDDFEKLQTDNYLDSIASSICYGLDEYIQERIKPRR